MNGFNNNYFSRDLINSMRVAIHKSLNEANTPSGRESGIGAGKTLMQPDKTWDEVAKSDSGVASWAKRQGKDINSIKFERRDGKVELAT